MARLSVTAHEMGTVRSVSLAVAFAWCGALVAGAFFVPMYATNGSAGAGSDTLVGVNGVDVLGVMMLPLILVVVVADLLWRRRTATTAGKAAWMVTGALAAFNVLAMLSIGIFVLPVTLALVVACASSNVPRQVLTDYKERWST